MHNLIHFNQLAAWNDNSKHLGETLDEFNEQGNIINDYYQCLIECSDNQSECKRICKAILSS